LPCLITVALVVVSESGEVDLDVAIIRVGNPTPVPPPGPEPPPPAPVPNPQNPYPTPKDQNLLSQLQSLKQVMKGVDAKTDSALLAKLYAQAADVTTDAGSAVCRSTGDVRTLILGFAATVDKANLKGKYPGLGKQLDALMLAQLGAENTYLSTESRAKAVVMLQGIAWALWEAGHQ
jgi:hypothetical protein